MFPLSDLSVLILLGSSLREFSTELVLPFRKPSLRVEENGRFCMIPEFLPGFIFLLDAPTLPLFPEIPGLWGFA